MIYYCCEIIRFTAMTEGSPLHLAVDYGFTEFIYLLLERKINLDEKNKFGQTALDVAAGSGSEEITQILVDAGAEINCTRKDGTTPIYMAAQNGHAGVVQVLLDGGARTDMKTDEGDTPMHAASRNGHIEIVKILHTAEGDIHCKTVLGATSLDTASFNGHNNVVSYLLGVGAVVNSKRKDGTTPLYVASQQGHIEVMNTLITGGAKVNSQDQNGATPLYAAAQQGHLDATQLLLTKGANPLIAKDGKWLPLHIAKLNDKPEIAELLSESREDGAMVIPTAKSVSPCSKDENPVKANLNVEVKPSLLLEKDRDVPSSLLWAVRLGDKATVKCILKRDCVNDVKYMKYEGQSAYNEAVIRGHHDITELIIQKCKEVLSNYLEGESRKCSPFWRVIARRLHVDYDDIEESLIDSDSQNICPHNMKQFLCYSVFLRWIDEEHGWPDIDHVLETIKEMEGEF
ncbi:uncharacterized protein LOC144444822 [Glandiceps talaboti]